MLALLIADILLRRLTSDLIFQSLDLHFQLFPLHYLLLQHRLFLDRTVVLALQVQ